MTADLPLFNIMVTYRGMSIFEPLLYLYAPGAVDAMVNKTDTRHVPVFMALTAYCETARKESIVYQLGTW